MRRIPSLLICSILAVAMVQNSAVAADELTPHSAEYKVKISLLSGRLSTRLSQTEDGYEAVHRIVPTGMARLIRNGVVEEFSGFESTEDGFVPTHYRSTNTLSKEETNADLEFDWSTRAVHGTVNSEEIDGVLEDFAYDRVSIQYELMRDLMNGGASETYVLFDIDELKTLNVEAIGTREVRVPAGRFTALGIRHQAEGSSRATTLWCVEELDYLPVIIEQHRKGKLRMRATLRSYTPDTT